MAKDPFTKPSPKLGIVVTPIDWVRIVQELGDIAALVHGQKPSGQVLAERISTVARLIQSKAPK